MIKKQVATLVRGASISAMKHLMMLFGFAVSVASAQVDLSVIGLQVVGDGYSPAGGDRKMNQELRAFNWSKGTKVALLLKSQGKAIVALDEDGSKISVFGDDQGTDFTKMKGKFGREGVGFGFPRVSEDGKALLAEVATSGIPKKGSKVVVLKGELLVSVASKSALKKSEVVELKKGAELTVGKYTFKVEKVGKPDWGDAALAISLKSPVDHKEFKGIVFYDAEGKEIESEQAGSGSMGMFGKRTYTVSFNFMKKIDKIIMGVEQWTDLEVIKVPIDLKVGAGL